MEQEQKTNPRYSTKHLGNLQINHTLRGKEDCREPDDTRQASHTRIPIPKPLRHITIQKQPNNLANICTVRQSSLPGRTNLVAPIGLPRAVLFIKLWKSIEVGEQTDLFLRSAMWK